MLFSEVGIYLHIYTSNSIWKACICGQNFFIFGKPHFHTNFWSNTKIEYLKFQNRQEQVSKAAKQLLGIGQDDFQFLEWLKQSYYVRLETSWRYTEAQISTILSEQATVTFLSTALCHALLSLSYSRYMLHVSYFFATLRVNC